MQYPARLPAALDMPRTTAYAPPEIV